MDFGELYKAAGATAGIGSFAFLVWDRLVKNRQLVSWSRDAAHLAIRLENFASESILIESITIEPSSISWTLSPDAKDIGNALARQTGSAFREEYGPASHPAIILGKGDVKLLSLVGAVEDLTLDLTATVRWSLLRSSWHPTMPVRLKASKHRRSMIQGAKQINTEAKAAP
jgi:hypothetical protein